LPTRDRRIGELWAALAADARQKCAGRDAGSYDALHCEYFQLSLVSPVWKSLANPAKDNLSGSDHLTAHQRFNLKL
jgi:hypothetical protein